MGRQAEGVQDVQEGAGAAHSRARKGAVQDKDERKEKTGETERKRGAKGKGEDEGKWIGAQGARRLEK